jgi:hypothetical protein
MMPELFTKPIEALTATDAVGVIGWPETLTVEFKQDLPGRDGRPDGWVAGRDVENYAKEKLFKEAVAFANTSGGHLLLGVAEEGAPLAHAAEILPVPRCIDLADRLARAAAQAIDPPIPLLLVRGIPTTADGAGIVVFRVPQSRLAPHRAPDKQCYIRRGTEAVPMGMREIQEMALAGGRRDIAIEERFGRASRVFERWSSEPQRGEALPDGVSFRITAVPVGSRFDLGRLYGHDTLVHGGEQYTLRVNGTDKLANAVRLPNASRPILRGIEWTCSKDGGCYYAAYGDGAIELGCRLRRLSGREPYLAIGWIVAHVVNVLRTADALRAAAGVADSEYGIEVELRAADPMQAVPLIWDHGGMFDGGIGDGLARLPLLLPRLSFGSVGELNNLVSILVNDICDAAAERRESPWQVEVL